MAGPIYGTETTVTTTSLDSLANSATAGWGSGYIDNTTNKFIDVYVNFLITIANTVPANNKCISIFAFGGNNITDLGTTGATTGGAAGTVGALTFPDISTLPNNLKLVGSIQYPANFASNTQEAIFSIAQAFGGVLPSYWGIALVNYSGAALSTGNVIKYQGYTLG
jgi:hypothetical protein